MTTAQRVTNGNTKKMAIRITDVALERSPAQSYRVEKIIKSTEGYVPPFKGKWAVKDYQGLLTAIKKANVALAPKNLAGR